nr:MAG TPA: hypothetical protein [Caudoviricetes sp.]
MESSGCFCEEKSLDHRKTTVRAALWLGKWLLHVATAYVLSVKHSFENTCVFHHYILFYTLNFLAYA